MAKPTLKKILENKDFLELFNDPAFIIDKNKNLLHYNYQYMNLCGLSPRQLKKKNPCRENFAPSICRDRCIFDECRKTEQPVQLREVDAKDREGNKLSLWVSAFPLFGEGERVEGGLIILRDMTVEAGIHSKYKVLYEREKEAKEHLGEVVEERTGELRTANIQLKIINKKLEELSIKDDLTELFNYRYFSEKIDFLFKETQKNKKPLSCIFIDVDFFKSINDTCDHQFGDFVLYKLGVIFKVILRKDDILARYGGDEFVVLFPNTSYKEAIDLAKKINTEVRKTVFDNGVFSRNASVSIGISSYPDDKIEAKNQLVKFADDALYEAKRRGRDTILPYEDIKERKP